MEKRAMDALTAVRRILRAAEFGARDLAERAGLTSSQIVVLQIVARDGVAGAGAIAEEARLSQATVTAICDRLEERQLLHRVRGVEDRRRVSLQLTEQGRKALADTPDFLQSRFLARFSGLKDWEQAMIVAALERVTMLLDAEGIDASPILEFGPIVPDADANL